MILMNFNDHILHLMMIDSRFMLSPTLVRKMWCTESCKNEGYGFGARTVPTTAVLPTNTMCKTA